MKFSDLPRCAQALLKYNPERQEVALTADRDYQAGERILAWCGPQPNSRVRLHATNACITCKTHAFCLDWLDFSSLCIAGVGSAAVSAVALCLGLGPGSQLGKRSCYSEPQLLVNYGIVEDNNPHDKLQLTATIPNSDPLFQVHCTPPVLQNCTSTACNFALSQRSCEDVHGITSIFANVCFFCSVNADANLPLGPQAKRAALQPAGLATQQAFAITASQVRKPETPVLPVLLIHASENEQT